MAFKIKVTQNGGTVWEYQWATKPTDAQIEEVTYDEDTAAPSDNLKLGRYAGLVCNAIRQIRDDAAILDIAYNTGMAVSRVK